MSTADDRRVVEALIANDPEVIEDSDNKVTLLDYTNLF